MSVILRICICVTADSAAAVETLRAELARAKEQARTSNVAAKKVAGEFKAEQTARRQCEERISTMALELKDATSRCQVLEKDNKAKAVNLDKALQEAKEARFEFRAARRRSDKLGRSQLVSPFDCKLSLAIQIMHRLINCGVLQTPLWICRRVLPMQISFSTCKKDMRWKSYFGRNLTCRSVHC